MTHFLRGGGVALLAFSLACPAAHASNDDVAAALAAIPDAVVSARAADGVPTFLSGDLAKVGEVPSDLAEAERALTPRLGSVLAAFRLQPSDVKLRRIQSGQDGQIHYRYRQFASGIEVVGGDLIVHVDRQGTVYAVNGGARGDLPRDATHDIAPARAFAQIADDGRFRGLSPGSARFVYLITATGGRHRTYEIQVSGMRGPDPVRDMVYVDAVSGNIVAVHPQIHFAEDRRVYSANNGTSLPGTLRKSEGQLQSTDPEVEFAYNNTGAFYEAHFGFWGRDSYDNLGAPLLSSVHYSTNYCNAFWNGGQLVFGDGNGTSCLSFAASVDYTAHELTHAVTERESNLIYSGESGGINESMSDIFGAFVEAWVDGGKSGVLVTSSDTWTFGEDVIAPAIRYLNDPAADGASHDFYSESIGNLDLHYSSGVGNLAFYLLSQGGLHPRDKSTVRVNGIGMEKAIRIFYEANVNFLTSTADYRILREAALQASVALGYDRATTRSVARAFAAVGIFGTSEPDIVLSITGLADDHVGRFHYQRIDVLAGQTLTAELAGGTGDADLYVRAGSRPTANAFDCRPWRPGNNEICSILAPGTSVYWIGVRTFAPYADVTLQASLEGP